MYAVTRLYTWDRKNTLTLCRHPPPLAPKIATTFIQQSPHGPSTTFSADLFGPGVAQRWTAHTQLVWRGRSHRRSARHRVTMEVPSRCERFRWPSPRLHRRNRFFWPFRGVWWCCGFGLGRPGLYDMAGNAITFVFSMRDIMNGCRLQWKPALTTVHAPPKITS